MGIKSVIDARDLIPNEFLDAYKGEQPVSSSMFDSVFLPLSRVPKALVDELAKSPQKLEQILLSEIPIFQAEVKKPYWTAESRGFTSIDIEIFGSVCLVDDRHALNVIVAHGSMIRDAGKYTLREICEGLGMQDVAWERLPIESLDSPLSNKGVYFHVDVNDVLGALGLTKGKINRKGLLDRLKRLSIMHLAVTPKLNGARIEHKTRAFSILGKDIFTVLDKRKIKNGLFNDDTFTDLIVNINSYYLTTLEQDGIISRKRLKTHYPYLNGKNGIVDVYNYIDSHKRSYMNGMKLSKLVQMYLDNKISTFGVNLYTKRDQIKEQIISDRQKLVDHFNLILKQGPNGDYVFYYLDEITSVTTK